MVHWWNAILVMMVAWMSLAFVTQSINIIRSNRKGGTITAVVLVLTIGFAVAFWNLF